MEFNGSLLMQYMADVKMVIETEHQQRMTLHCQQCNTVLGDSIGICGEIKCMEAIMCLRVTDDVVVSDAKESRHKGEMASCIYSPLKCRGCKAAVGKVIHSAPPRLAPARSIFLLNKANISCYILNSGSMVKASTLTFDLKPVRESIKEVRQQFDVLLDQMSHIKSRLANRGGTNQ
ncbi:protein Mis18-beta [Chaetodon trifascialis]|uniref:protein Mis18-beta n=1 Tax=Chaetodon trifascialis TaxID=109706 RepID=UPI00399306C3